MNDDFYDNKVKSWNLKEKLKRLKELNLFDENGKARYRITKKDGELMYDIIIQMEREIADAEMYFNSR